MRKNAIFFVCFLASVICCFAETWIETEYLDFDINGDAVTERIAVQVYADYDEELGILYDHGNKWRVIAYDQKQKDKTLRIIYQKFMDVGTLNIYVCSGISKNAEDVLIFEKEMHGPLKILKVDYNSFFKSYHIKPIYTFNITADGINSSL